MATRTVTLDDLTGDEGAQTVRFGLGDLQWDIDLTPDSLSKLAKLIEPYTSKAREVTKKAAANGGELAAIREWAAAQDPPIEVASKGRISQDVVDKYHAAHADPS
jgi:uncharacterized protein (DUF4415 family)